MSARKNFETETPDVTTASSLERFMLELINEERTSRGLEPLLLDRVLNAAADRHADWILQTGTFSHTGAGGSSPQERILAEGFDLSGSWRTAENLAIQSERRDAGLFDDVRDLHVGLMNSPGHRANILHPDLEVVGIGILTGSFTYGSGTFASVVATQKFARTDGAVTPDVQAVAGQVQPQPEAESPTITTDSITLTERADSPTNGADTITLTEGDEIIIGHAGEDTVVVGAASDNVTILIGEDLSLTVVDRNGTGGTDRLSNVDVLQFADRSFRLDDYDSAVELTAPQLFDLSEMYMAYFNRSPDAFGFYYWADKYAEGMSMEQIAEFFFYQAETRALYPDLSDTDAFVTAVYANVLGRTPDADGLAFWREAVAGGAVSQGEFVLEIIRGAKAGGNAEDVAFLATKAELGLYYATVRGLSDVDDAAHAMVVFGNQETADAAAARAAIDQHHADATASGAGDFILGLIGVLDDSGLTMG